MKNTTGFVEGILIKEVSKGGVKLLIIVTRSDNNEWELSAQNEYGISSNWLENIANAQLAIDTGLRAIEEDLESFMETEGFEYLLHDLV